MRERIELIGAWIAATAILFMIILLVNVIFDFVAHMVKEKPMPITQQWLDEETRCFCQGDRLVNCEKYPPDDHP